MIVWGIRRRFVRQHNQLQIAILSVRPFAPTRVFPEVCFLIRVAQSVVTMAECWFSERINPNDGRTPANVVGRHRSGSHLLALNYFPSAPRFDRKRLYGFQTSFRKAGLPAGLAMACRPLAIRQAGSL